MELDIGRVMGWDPPWWHERELHHELWSVTRIALRSWLKASAMTDNNETQIVAST